jgi:DNA-binding IclR family transcriptional regulator
MTALTGGSTTRPDTGTTGELSSLDRGLQILTFIQDRGQVEVVGIVEGLGIPPSTVYRYVRMLKTAGFVVDMGGQLLPSVRLADPSASGSRHLVDLARPVLGHLRQRTELSVALTVRVHTAALCLDTWNASSGNVAYHPGEVLALYAGASATTLLAMAPASVQRQVLSGRITQFTAATPGAKGLREELTLIRRQGYHVTRGWLTPGMTAVGVPVLTAGTCLCALSLIGPDSQLRDVSAAVRLLRDAAGELIARLPRAPTVAWSPPEPEGTV